MPFVSESRYEGGSKGSKGLCGLRDLAALMKHRRENCTPVERRKSRNARVRTHRTDGGRAPWRSPSGIPSSDREAR